MENRSATNATNSKYNFGILALVLFGVIFYSFAPKNEVIQSNNYELAKITYDYGLLVEQKTIGNDLQFEISNTSRSPKNTATTLFKTLPEQPCNLNLEAIKLYCFVYVDSQNWKEVHQQYQKLLLKNPNFKNTQFQIFNTTGKGQFLIWLLHVFFWNYVVFDFNQI